MYNISGYKLNNQQASWKKLYSIITIIALALMVTLLSNLAHGTSYTVYKSYSTMQVERIEDSTGKQVSPKDLPAKYELVWVK